MLKDKASLLKKQGKYLEALSVFNKIKENNQFFNQKYYIEIIDDCIDECKEKLAIHDLCYDDACLADQSSRILRQIMCRIEESGIEKRSNTMKEFFDTEFLKRKKISDSEYNEIRRICSLNPHLDTLFVKDEMNTDYFQVLRRWNSYTPIINSRRGGGYFLRVDGVGIVIDPGFNFIKNYRESGNYFRDIDIVLISHAHDDHTADMESILNLQYRFNKQLKNTALMREIAKEYGLSAGDIEGQNRRNGNTKVQYNSIHVSDSTAPAIKVISDIDFRNKLINYDYVEPKDVKVGEYRFKNLLFYYSKAANVTEGDIVQAFIDGFTSENKSVEISI